MAIRRDRFEAGAVVAWSPSHREQGLRISDGRKGPFRVDMAIDVPFAAPGSDYRDGEQSNWSAMGHTQFLVVDGLSGKWSGAYFEKIEDEPSSTINDLSDDRDALASAGFIEED